MALNNLSELELSVFFPAYNEEQNIITTITKADQVLKSLNLKNYEIIVINDGSEDKTAAVVEKLTLQNSRIRLVNHPKNLGYGHALKTGFQSSKYPWVFFADSDGQFDFSEIGKFLKRGDEADLIVGYRLNRADSLMRKTYTFFWNGLARILLGLTLKDYSCGFKLIKRKVFEAVGPLQAEEKVTQIEMLVKAKRMGFKFLEVGVNHYPRRYGTPTGAKIKVVVRSMIDLLKLWWRLT